MKGCRNCGCTEFIVEGWIDCKGIVDLTGNGPNYVTVEKVDYLDFEKYNDSPYTCRECGIEYKYEEIIKIANEGV